MEGPGGERTGSVVLLLVTAAAGTAGPGEVNSRALLGTSNVVLARESPGDEKLSGSDVMIRTLRCQYRTKQLTWHQRGGRRCGDATVKASTTTYARIGAFDEDAGGRDTLLQECDPGKRGVGISWITGSNEFLCKVS